MLPEAFQHMTDEGGRVTMNELLVFFKDRQDTRKPVCSARLFVGHRYARPSQRRAKQTGKVLFCSPRDTRLAKRCRLRIDSFSQRINFTA